MKKNIVFILFVISQSLGGLLATEILFKKSELFTHYSIIIPSLWLDCQSLLQNASNFYQK